MSRVSSPRNARLREVARLIASSRDRRKSGRCVLEGAHLIDVFVGRFGAPETLVVLEEATVRPDVADLVARVPASRTLVVSHDVFDELATLPADVAVLAVVATPRVPPPAPADFCLLLEDVQDPGNVGSIIRTAAAAGVPQVWLSPGCAFASRCAAICRSYSRTCSQPPLPSHIGYWSATIRATKASASQRTEAL